jgi:hypothetical protein
LIFYKQTEVSLITPLFAHGSFRQRQKALCLTTSVTGLTMNTDDEWDYVRGADEANSDVAKSGALRVSLLFGSIAVAFALFLVPLMNRGGYELGINTPGSVDRIATGSITQAGEYTVRRSVLQKVPGALCVIRNDGSSSGDC